MTAIRTFLLCCLPDCSSLSRSAINTLLSFKNSAIIFHLPPLPSWGKHAWVQHWVQLECKWIDTSELIPTHRQTHTHTHARRTPYACPHSIVQAVFKYIQHIQQHTASTLTHIRSSAGTPVTLRVPIVVHLAVLCSTLFPQHAYHLKPNTYGPASCRSPTLRLLFCFVFFLPDSKVLIVPTLLYS